MASDLKVMTFNLRCDCEGDRHKAGSNSWGNRLPLAREVIEGQDFVCTQEGSRKQLDELIHGTGFSWIGRHTGKKAEPGERSGHNAIVYRRHTWEVEQSGPRAARAYFRIVLHFFNDMLIYFGPELV